jgi:hypothetical protein
LRPRRTAGYVVLLVLTSASARPVVVITAFEGSGSKSRRQRNYYNSYLYLQILPNTRRQTLRVEVFAFV